MFLLNKETIIRKWSITGPRSITGSLMLYETAMIKTADIQSLWFSNYLKAYKIDIFVVHDEWANSSKKPLSMQSEKHAQKGNLHPTVMTTDYGK